MNSISSMNKETSAQSGCRLKYLPPRIRRIVPLAPDEELLAGSNLGNAKIYTAGQEIAGEYEGDGSDGNDFYNVWSSGFRHEWF